MLLVGHDTEVLAQTGRFLGPFVIKEKQKEYRKTIAISGGSNLKRSATQTGASPFLLRSKNRNLIDFNAGYPHHRGLPCQNHNFQHAPRWVGSCHFSFPWKPQQDAHKNKDTKKRTERIGTLSSRCHHCQDSMLLFAHVYFLAG